MAQLFFSYFGGRARGRRGGDENGGCNIWYANEVAVGSNMQMHGRPAALIVSMKSGRHANEAEKRSAALRWISSLFFLLVGKTNPPPPPPPTNCRHYELICKCVLKKREQKRNTRSVLDRWTKNTNKKRHRLLWRMPSNGVEFYGCDDRRRWLIDRATYMQLY